MSDQSMSDQSMSDQSMSDQIMANQVRSIAILGGTGDLGGGLARQWSRAGYKILIGSRTLEKGKAAAHALLAEFPDLSVSRQCKLMPKSLKPKHDMIIY